MTETEKMLEQLEKVYYGAKPALNFSNAYELLVATILSAQCTDARVNKVTDNLFVHYPNAESLSKAKLNELEEEIHSCGCYAVKAKHLKNSAEMICKNYNGEVPKTMDELTSLPGVGRKTANVVLSNAFGIPGIAVDTHVFRVSNRLGLANADTVEKTEIQLMNAIPKEKWGNAHHWLIYHGRQICTARSPKCETCFLNELCHYYKNRKVEK